MALSLHMLRRVIAIAGLLSAAAYATSQRNEVRNVAAADCAPTVGLAFVCGAERPEDVVRIPGTRWLIASGFSEGAGLKLVDTDSHRLQFWYSGSTGQRRDTERYPDCASAPDPLRFNTQGISLRGAGEARYTLHVVNHGGRESVEVFDIDASADLPTLTWRGCVLMPPGYAANSVATYSDGTILTTVLTRPGTTITDFWRGEITGGVYEWKPGDVFRLLPGTELPGNNGIETARDDRAFYVVAFGWRSIVVFSRADTRHPVARVQAPGFMPDNIHWDSGRLITAGMQYDEPACGGTRKIVNGKADEMRCHRGYTVAEFDPASMSYRTVAYAEPDPHFNGVSASAVIDGSLWLGSYQADRLATRRLPSASP